MKLYAKPGFESFEQGRSGHWCPVLTGRTDTVVLDCNSTTKNDANLLGYTDLNSAWIGTRNGVIRGYDGLANRDVCTNNPLNGAKNFAISIWVLRTTVAAGNIIGNQFQTLSVDITGFRLNYNRFGSNGLNGASFALQTGKTATNGENGWSTPSNSFTQNRLINCVLNFKSDIAVEFFLDGQQVQTTNWTGSTNTIDVKWGATDRGLGFGRSSQSYGAAFFAGQISETITYNERTFSADEALQIYQAGPGGLWQLQPRRPRSYFAQVLSLVNRRRSSRFLGFPG